MLSPHQSVQVTVQPDTPSLRRLRESSCKMKIKRILTEANLVIADVEVEHNGALRSRPTLCAVIKGADGTSDSIVPLNTPDGRPIFLTLENAIKL